jgi:hypothetical protein
VTHLGALDGSLVCHMLIIEITVDIMLVTIYLFNVIFVTN